MTGGIPHGLLYPAAVERMTLVLGLSSNDCRPQSAALRESARRDRSQASRTSATIGNPEEIRSSRCYSMSVRVVLLPAETSQQGRHLRIIGIQRERPFSEDLRRRPVFTIASQQRQNALIVRMPRRRPFEHFVGCDRHAMGIQRTTLHARCELTPEAAAIIASMRRVDERIFRSTRTPSAPISRGPLNSWGSTTCASTIFAMKESRGCSK